MKNFFTKNKSNKKRGFTLLETLVSILILSLAVASAMTIAQKSLQAAIYSRDETTATYLASEGIELVRAIRDGNSITKAGWLDNMIQCVGTNIYCDIHPLDLTQQTSCSNTPTGATVPACPLSVDSNGVYGWVPGTGNTNFYRSINVQEIQGGIEAVVTVTVAWKSSAFQMRQISLQEHIFNWRQ